MTAWEEMALSTGREKKRGLRTQKGKHEHGRHGEKKRNPKKETRKRNQKHRKRGASEAKEGTCQEG